MELVIGSIYWGDLGFGVVGGVGWVFCCLGVKYCLGVVVVFGWVKVVLKIFGVGFVVIGEG